MTWCPVTQTRTGFPAGNCTEAALASLLGCDLDEVPVLWCGRLDVTTDDEAQPPERMAALMDWLRARGWEWREWQLPAGPLKLPLHVSQYVALSGWRGSWDAPHLSPGPIRTACHTWFSGLAARCCGIQTRLGAGLSPSRMLASFGPRRSSMIDEKTLDNWFTYHPPTEETAPKYAAISAAEDAAFEALELAWGQAVPAGYGHINDACKRLAVVIDQEAPDSADKSSAIRCVRLARNAANEALRVIIDTSNAYTGDRVAVLWRQTNDNLRAARWQANSAIACGGK